MPLLYGLAGVLLFAGGLLHLVLRSHPIRRILAVNVMSNGVFLVLIGLARRAPERPDPVPQAMVLTGIVVAVCATGVGLLLAVRLRSGRGDTPGALKAPP